MHRNLFQGNPPKVTPPYLMMTKQSIRLK